ncbi:MAG TPA: hypothetical protein VL442_12315 [Mucilaginibacter sp.]|jgi:hypothetical protein|nr:hypothetical protein [Mucilaginibacter sp.]
MKRSTCLNWLIVFGLFVPLLGCSFRVTAPLPSDTTATVNGFSTDASGHLVITVSFSDPVNESTVIPQRTLILKFAKNANENATLTWLNSKTLKIVTVDKRDDLMVFAPDGSFSLTLIGTDVGNGAVKSTSGAILDGNYDGKPGGDYVKGFTIIG